MCRSTAAALAFALAVVLGAAVAHAQATTGELSGVVVDARRERPIVGVTVTLAGSDRSAITDEAGRFRLIGAPAGRAHAGADAARRGRRSASTRRSWPVATGRCAISSTSLRRAAPTNRPCARRASSAPAWSRSASRAKRRAASPAPRDDPLKVVEDLPGVARATVGTGDVIVWGAAPADTRVVFDGVELPALFHVGGWRSTVAPGLVARVALTPGGFGVEWGRALGGLVRVDGAPPPPAGFHGEVGADLLDGSGAAVVRARPLRAHARRPLLVARSRRRRRRAGRRRRVHPAAALGRLPAARLRTLLGAREHLTLTFLAADDSLSARSRPAIRPPCTPISSIARATACSSATTPSATAAPSRSRRFSATTDSRTVD